MKHLILSICLFAMSVGTMVAQDQPSYSVPVTITSDTYTYTVYIGVNAGNTIGIDEDETLGDFVEEQLPPSPPAPFDFDARLVTIPYRVSTYPTGLGTGVQKDYHGYESPSQVDTFRIQMSGTLVENNGVVLSWPSDLSTYASSWIIKGIAGASLAETSMTGNTSVKIDPIYATLQVLIITSGIAVDVEQIAPAAEGYALEQNYPNPFNPATTITYSISTNEYVTLDVYNAMGQAVMTLVAGEQNPGTYRVQFDANGLASGLYFYRLSAGTYTNTRSMVLVK